MGYIEGNFKRSIFESDSGYVIGLFKVQDVSDESLSDLLDKTITFTGYFHELNDKDLYIMNGQIVKHPKYGTQFQVESYERKKPAGRDALVEFLTSGLFKGIGEKKAKLIVETLGDDTFRTILETPDNLLLIPTITKKNVDTLHEKLKEYEKSYETIIYLGELGFTPKDSMQIYNKYKGNTKNIIDENIYNIYLDILDITFKKVDQIATSIGYEKTDIRRVSSSIIYIMNEVSNAYGHEYFYKEDIYIFLNRVIGEVVEEEIFEDALKLLEKNLQIKIDKDKYYLINMYTSIKTIVQRFKRLSNEKDLIIKNIEKEIENVEKRFEIKYNEEQLKAITDAIKKHTLIITGGPGTGKTTILRGIIELYKTINKYSYIDLENRVALLSPTGRAAKRMTESSGLRASTIHRFLKWQKDSGAFLVNKYNRSDVELVIIDESSMIDTYLLASLIDGLYSNTKIILIGDDHQLPSVGPGEVLKDLIESDIISTIKLTKLYRQKEDSNILSLAYDIRNGQINENIFNETEDLTFIKTSSIDIPDVVKELADTYKEENYKDIQVLTPLYKGICGIDIINSKIQDIINKKTKDKKEIRVGEEIIRENDKVIQLTNQPDDNVYNGDIGIVERIYTNPKKEIHINFDGNKVKYTPSGFNNFRLAYSISIHKSQGSEFDTVIIPVARNYSKMLYRKLYYTAITRAKKRLILVGEINALNYAAKNESDLQRRTIIKEYMQKGIN